MHRNMLAALMTVLIMLVLTVVSGITFGDSTVFNVTLSGLLFSMSWGLWYVKKREDILFALIYIAASFVGGIIFACIAARNDLPLYYFRLIYILLLTTMVLLTMTDDLVRLAIPIAICTCLTSFVIPWQVLASHDTGYAVSIVMRDLGLTVCIRLLSLPRDNDPPKRRRKVKKAKRNKRWTRLLPSPA